MKQKMIQNRLWLFLCVALIAAGVCMFTACSKDQNSEESAEVWLEGGTLGEGEYSFAFTAVDKEGKTAEFTIQYQDAKTVGEALIDVGLISGEEGEFGLYVKRVNGVFADYTVTGDYWAFYADGAYSKTGVEKTPITEGVCYMFKVEK